MEENPATPPRNDRAWLAILLAAHLAAAALLTSGWIRPDSIAVYSPLRSLVHDGDFLFFDEWAAFGMVRDGFTLFKEIAPTGALANHWWVGTSLLTSPLYLLAHLLTDGDGFNGLYAAVLSWASVLFGALASLTAFSILRGEGVSERNSLFAIAAIWIGTPMFWYEYRFPLGTHLAGVLMVALLVRVLASRDAEGSRRRDLLVGLLFGFAVITRLQHVVLGPAVVLHLFRSRRSWKSLVSFSIGAALPLLVQGIVWQAVYGTPLGPLIAGASPLGGTWMPFRRNYLTEVLLSSYHGLMPWAPVALLAIAGWLLNLRRSPLALTLLLMFAGEWFANGFLDRYFWGGMSFGPRRFVDLAVPFAIGLGWVVESRRWTVVPAAVAALWSSLLALAAAAGTLHLSRDVLPVDLIRAIGEIDLASLRAALAGSSIWTRMPGAAAAGGAIAIVAGGLLVRFARDERRLAILLASLATVGIIASAAAIPQTRERAPLWHARLGLDLEASRSKGPLLDARALLSDEAAFLRNRGRMEEAAEVQRLIARIEQQLE